MSDPIVDTPMVVTLDALRPYDHNPRLTRNPLHDDIKASIRERGLDAPPAITRRPNESHFMIRNGGNTRLAILRELWSETKEERFFRIPCLFRPWPARGEIIALTGHLAENELHGSLTFIERALGVEKARELYAVEAGKALSQSELARRLAADGYPVPQPHISRMHDAVQYLLPAIPNLLYGGLGRPQVEKLAALRHAGLRIWQRHAGAKGSDEDFARLLHAVLAGFDATPESFCWQRAQDELLGRMAERLEKGYDELALELTETEMRQRALAHVPSIADPPSSQQSCPFPLSTPANGYPPRPKPTPHTQQHILRTRIARLANEIAQEAGLAESIEAIETGIGFACADEPADQHTPFGRAVAALLRALSTQPGSQLTDASIPTETWAILMQDSATRPRLSDAALTRLFRLIRLARRLLKRTHRPLDGGSHRAVPNHEEFECRDHTL